MHIYRTNKSRNKFVFYYSSFQDNPFTWTKYFVSESPIYISKDSVENGVIYLAAGRDIYKSTNFGHSFSYYKSLSGQIVGIYKKPNSPIPYAATRSMIFEIQPSSIRIIKNFRLVKKL